MRHPPTCHGEDPSVEMADMLEPSRSSAAITSMTCEASLLVRDEWNSLQLNNHAGKFKTLHVKFKSFRQRQWQGLCIYRLSILLLGSCIYLTPFLVRLTMAWTTVWAARPSWSGVYRQPAAHRARPTPITGTHGDETLVRGPVEREDKMKLGSTSTEMGTGGLV